MPRPYSVRMPEVSLSAAKSLIRLSAPATKSIIITGLIVTQRNSTTTSQVGCILQRASTDGTGTAATAELLDPGDSAYGGSAVVNLTAEPTLTGAPLWSMGFNFLNGWSRIATPDMRIVVPGAGRIVLRMDSAPSGGAATIAAVLEFIAYG